MKEMISHCGLKCNECAAYKATKNDDDNERKKVAEEWSKRYESNIKPEDINCEGCLSRGNKVFNHCNVCEIRKCGIEKGVSNCAHCEEYVCDKLEDFFKMVPDNRKTLDRIRKTIE